MAPFWEWQQQLIIMRIWLISTSKLKQLSLPRTTSIPWYKAPTSERFLSACRIHLGAYTPFHKCKMSSKTCFICIHMKQSQIGPSPDQSINQGHARIGPFIHVSGWVSTVWPTWPWTMSKMYSPALRWLSQSHYKPVIYNVLYLWVIDISLIQYMLWI